MFRIRSDETSDSGTDLNMASTRSSTDLANAGPIAKTRDGVSTLGRRSVKHQGHAQLMLLSLRGTADWGVRQVVRTLLTIWYSR